jgi:peptidoglycan/LPS O-acetylase OafA/YrhL
VTVTASISGERLYSLDAARAIAALIVVFQHWEHFLAVPAFAGAKEESPLYWLFQPFYEKGARAVTFFFCLSGFIFYWLYSRKVFEKTVGPATFAVLRLSRLYPLHLLTLLAVLALQWPLIERFGEPFIYPEHDVKHFALNFLLIQYWGFEDGFSFNGPSWSISVELFLYIAFFAACRFIRPSIWQCLALAAVGLLLARFSVLATAATPFFLGGAAYHLYRMLQSGWTPLRNIALVATMVVLWLTLPNLLNDNQPFEGIAGRAALELAQRQFELLLFPGTVLALALSESVWKRIPWRRLHSLGNMSFGIYLLHFPLQMVFVLAALALALPADTFTHPAALIVFIAALIALAALSYYAFERPVMDGLRRAWKQARGKPVAKPVPAPSI